MRPTCSCAGFRTKHWIRRVPLGPRTTRTGPLKSKAVETASMSPGCNSLKAGVNEMGRLSGAELLRLVPALNYDRAAARCVSTQMQAAVSPAFRSILLGSEEMQRNVCLIANDPAVVRHRRNVKEFACFQFDHATVIKCNCCGSRENKPDMFNRTMRRANTQANVLAPFPPGLIRRPTNCDSAEVNQLKFSFLHHAHFIRCVERFQNDCHLLAVHGCPNIENLRPKSKNDFRHYLATIARRSASIARGRSRLTRCQSPQSSSVTPGTTPRRSR